MVELDELAQNDGACFWAKTLLRSGLELEGRATPSYSRLRFE